MLIYIMTSTKVVVKVIQKIRQYKAKICSDK